MKRRDFLVQLSATVPTAASEMADSGSTDATFAAWVRSTPALSLKDNRSTVHTVDEFRGRVVLVHFWASWCEPCRQEIPAVSAIARRYAPAGLSLD